MKRLLPLVLACVCAVSAATRKKPTDDSDGSSSEAPSGSGTVSANVGGANFSASGSGNVTAARESSGANFSIPANSGGATIAVVMSGPTAPGTYNLGPGGVGAGSYTAGASAWQSSIGAGTGTVTFTVLSNDARNGNVFVQRRGRPRHECNGHQVSHLWRVRRLVRPLARSRISKVDACSALHWARGRCARTAARWAAVAFPMSPADDVCR